MHRFLAVFLSACLLAMPQPARAESLIVEYYSLLGPVDAYNSRGVPLNDLCALVQQDRANWHRFGRREAADNGDWFFDSTARRAMIAGRCDYSRAYYTNAGNRIRSGTRSFYVWVQVFGHNGVVSRVVVREGAG